MGGPQFGAALFVLWLVAGCWMWRSAATSEAEDGTAGLCAVLSEAMKYIAVAYSFSTQWKLRFRLCQIVVCRLGVC